MLIVITLFRLSVYLTDRPFFGDKRWWMWSLVATPAPCALPSCHTTTYFFFFPLFTVLTMDGPGGVGDWRPGEDGLR